MDRKKTPNGPWVFTNQLPILQNLHDDCLKAKPQHSICSNAECTIRRVTRRSVTKSIPK